MEILIVCGGLAAGFVVFQFLGYFIHRFFHDPLSWRLYRSHKSHHWDLYPPERYLSDGYYKPPWYDRPILYYIPPMIGLGIVLWWLFPLWFFLPVISELAIVAWLNDFIHEKFHLRRTFLLRYPRFRKWRMLHFIHHVDEKKNFGIFWFVPDRVFGTMDDFGSVKEFYQKSRGGSVN